MAHTHSSVPSSTFTRAVQVRQKGDDGLQEERIVGLSQEELSFVFSDENTPEDLATAAAAAAPLQPVFRNCTIKNLTIV